MCVGGLRDKPPTVQELLFLVLIVILLGGSVYSLSRGIVYLLMWIVR